MKTQAHVDAEELRRFCQAALVASGAATESARETAEGLLYADLHGIDGQGVADLDDGYLCGLARGHVNGRVVPRVVLDRAGVGLVNAQGGLGHPAAALAMDLAIQKAQRCGIGAVGVFNSAHCGAIGHYTHRAAMRGVVGLALTNCERRPAESGCPDRIPPKTRRLAMTVPGGGIPHFGIQIGARCLADAQPQPQPQPNPARAGWSEANPSAIVLDRRAPKPSVRGCEVGACPSHCEELLPPRPLWIWAVRND